MEQQKSSPKKNHKWVKPVVTAVVAVAVAGSGTAWAFNYVRTKNASSSTVSYRSYTAASGDLTVGTTESGTVALDDTNVTFPVSAEVSSVIAKSGQSVKKGDTLLQLDLTSINDSTSDLKQKLEAAKLSLQQAISDQGTKLESAKITYESSKDLATTAPITKTMTLSQLQNAITTAQTQLANDKKDLETYTALQKTWAADYAKLQQLEQWMEDAEASKVSYTTQLSDYETENSTVIKTYDNLKSTVESDRAYYIQAKNTGETVNNMDFSQWHEQMENDQETLDAYYTNAAQPVLTQQTELKEKVAQYTAEATNYTNAYNDFKETYSDKYKVTGTELDNKVTALQQSIKTDQDNLTKAQQNAEVSSINAQTSEENSLNTADNAQNAYDLTVSQLASAVSTAQASYDSLQEQMNEIDSALTGDGTVTAPCDGFVSVVNVKAGSTMPADTTLMVISKTTSISMSISVSEDDVSNVKLGQSATITLSSQDSTEIPATVSSITASPARSSSSSVTYTVTVQSTGDLSGLGTVYDGMSGEATVLQKQVKDVVYVNNKAITFNNGVSTVLVKNSDGTNETRTVNTGFSDGTYVQITNGLKSGETVLAESAVSTT